MREQDLIRRFPRARVLVIGDLMLDRFVWGDVRRISPEAPVPVVQVRRESVCPGGAGNVVANLAALGAPPEVIGWVGRDGAGREIVNALRELGAGVSGLIASPDCATIEKTRIIAHSQQVVRLDRDPDAAPPGLERQLRRRLEAHLGQFDAVVVSDYGKGTIGPALLELLADRRRRGGFALLIDPKQPNFGAYRGATLVKPNESEASAAAGAAIRDDLSLRAVGERLLDLWQSESVLISRGEHGMALCRPGELPRQFPAAAREVFDVTGAGDTVLAVAALALASGGNLDAAARLANLGAGIVVGKIGTATVSRAELLSQLGVAATPSKPRKPRARGAQ